MHTRIHSQQFNSNHRNQIIAGYDLLIGEILLNDDAEPYYVNFMFNRLPGGQAARIQQMWQEVTRFHGLLKRHVVRKPDSPRWRGLVPALIGAPDFPVWKHEKVSAEHGRVNDGLHFNAIVMMPPRFCPAPGEPKRLQFERVSRLSVTLDKHVQQRERIYRTDKLYRIHVTPIAEGTMADYALKAFKNGRVGYDDILILN